MFERVLSFTNWAISTTQPIQAITRMVRPRAVIWQNPALRKPSTMRTVTSTLPRILLCLHANPELSWRGDGVRYNMWQLVENRYRVHSFMYWTNYSRIEVGTIQLLHPSVYVEICTNNWSCIAIRVTLVFYLPLSRSPSRHAWNESVHVE